MTFIEILIAGFGAILIISALEDQPIIATFQGVISGQPIVIATATPTNFTPTPPQTSNPKGPGYVPPVNNKCPAGQVWDPKTGQCLTVA